MSHFSNILLLLTATLPRTPTFVSLPLYHAHQLLSHCHLSGMHTKSKPVAAPSGWNQPAPRQTGQQTGQQDRFSGPISCKSPPTDAAPAETVAPIAAGALYIRDIVVEQIGQVDIEQFVEGHHRGHESWSFVNCSLNSTG